jgi:hypothetical protein
MHSALIGWFHNPQQRQTQLWEMFFLRTDAKLMFVFVLHQYTNRSVWLTSSLTEIRLPLAIGCTYMMSYKRHHRLHYLICTLIDTPFIRFIICNREKMPLECFRI